MKTLNENWFTEGRIDFELKRYTILSYLQGINAAFGENKLYPPFADLIYHYGKLLDFKENKDTMYQLFPDRLIDINIEKQRLTYEKLVEEDAVMQEIEAIISFSLDQMNDCIRGGKEIYDYVEDRLSIQPIGLVPIRNDRGYLFFKDGLHRETRVYEYQITLIENSREKLRGIHTRYVASYPLSLINTPESIKLELIRNRQNLPNPAVFQIETDLIYPIEDTLLPVAKRSLVKFIAAA